MALSRLTLALEKHGLTIPDGGNVAVLRAVSMPDHPALPKSRLRLFNSFRPVYDKLIGAGYEVASEPEGQFSASIVTITRSKAETLGLVARSLEMTGSEGILVVDGPKTDGIESILKRVKSVFDIEGSLAKSHGKIFWFRRPKTLPVEVAAWRAAADYSTNSDGFQTAPGMFSPDKIDNGSLLLAANFNEKVSGNVADLGAGWGWLASQSLEKGKIDHIDLFEAEKTALDAARLNVSDARARFYWADVLTMAAKAEYDTVVSNPPFHQGRSADYSMGAGFISKAASMLKPRGSLWLVANRHLPYEKYLDEAFSHWETMEQTPYFKVLRAHKPQSGTSRNLRRNPVKSR